MKITFTRRGKGVALLAALLALVLAVPRPAYALFGAEDTVEMGPGWQAQWGAQYAVFGHIWSQDISTYLKVIETVTQLEKIYSNALQMYNLAQAMRVAFTHNQMSTFETLAQMAATDVTRDQYGENTAWSSTLNGNPSRAQSAWQMSTVALNNGINLANETPGHSGSLARLASIEAMDGASTGCLQTLGQYHANSVANALGPVLKLAIARMDGTSSTNSMIQQLNLLNAHQGQSYYESAAQGQINSCIAQQLVLQNKIQRDTQAEAFNTFATVDNAYTSNPMQLSKMSTSFSGDIY